VSNASKRDFLDVCHATLLGRNISVGLSSIIFNVDHKHIFYLPGNFHLCTRKSVVRLRSGSASVHRAQFSDQNVTSPPLRAQSQRRQTKTENVHTIASFSYQLSISICYLKDTNAAFSLLVKIQTSLPFLSHHPDLSFRCLPFEGASGERGGGREGEREG